MVPKMDRQLMGGVALNRYPLVWADKARSTQNSIEIDVPQLDFQRTSVDKSPYQSLILNTFVFLSKMNQWIDEEKEG